MESISKYNVKGLLFDMPLYERVSINIKDIEKDSRTEVIYENFMELNVSVYEEKYPKEFSDFIDFLSYEDNLYGYCHKCKRENSLKLDKINVDEILLRKELNGTYDDDFDDYDEDLAKIKLNERIDILLKKHKYFIKSVRCLHDSNHKQKFIYKLEVQEKTNTEAELILQKIGQDPSFLELNFYEYDNKYKKLEFYGQIKEDLKKSIRSYYEGLGIGAFIYLRRVLEKIIKYKFNEVNEELEKDEVERFKKKNKPFYEKVKILKEYLPEYLTKNPQIYAILSEGVHKLSEEEVNKYFETIKKCIYIILDDFLHEQEEQKLRKNISDSLSNINTKIKSNKNLT